MRKISKFQNPTSQTKNVNLINEKQKRAVKRALNTLKSVTCLNTGRTSCGFFMHLAIRRSMTRRDA